MSCLGHGSLGVPGGQRFGQRAVPAHLGQKRQYISCGHPRRRSGVGGLAAREVLAWRMFLIEFIVYIDPHLNLRMIDMYMHSHNMHGEAGHARMRSHGTCLHWRGLRVDGLTWHVLIGSGAMNGAQAEA